MIRVHFNDDRLTQHEVITRGELGDTGSGELNRIRRDDGSLVLMQAQYYGHIAIPLRQVFDEPEIAEGVQQTKRIHGAWTERILAIGDFEMSSCPADLVVAQQVDTQRLMRCCQARFDVDSLLVQVDCVTIAALDDLEMRRRRKRVAPERIVVERKLGPWSRLRAADEVGGRAQSVNIQRRPVGTGNDLFGLRQRVESMLTVAGFQRRSRHQQQGGGACPSADRGVIEQLAEYVVGRGLETVDKNARGAETRPGISGILCQHLAIDIDGIGVLMGIGVQIAPPHTRRDLVRRCCECLTKESIGGLAIIERPGRLGPRRQPARTVEQPGVTVGRIRNPAAPLQSIARQHGRILYGTVVNRPRCNQGRRAEPEKRSQRCQTPGKRETVTHHLQAPARVLRWRLRAVPARASFRATRCDIPRLTSARGPGAARR